MKTANVKISEAQFTVQLLVCNITLHGVLNVSVRGWNLDFSNLCQGFDAG